MTPSPAETNVWAAETAKGVSYRRSSRKKLPAKFRQRFPSNGIAFRLSKTPNSLERAPTWAAETLSAEWRFETLTDSVSRSLM
jgi:hypothetical protein